MCKDCHRLGKDWKAHTLGWQSINPGRGATDAETGCMRAGSSWTGKGRSSGAGSSGPALQDADWAAGPDGKAAVRGGSGLRTEAGGWGERRGGSGPRRPLCGGGRARETRSFASLTRKLVRV